MIDLSTKEEKPWNPVAGLVSSSRFRPTFDLPRAGEKEVFCQSVLSL